MYEANKVQTLSIRLKAAVVGLSVALIGEAAFAQSSTNCIAMGPGMMHCDTMRMAPEASGDGGEALGMGIGALIARNREMSLRKKIGKMLSNGDCKSAVALAYGKGRLELAESIRNSCPTG